MDEFDLRNNLVDALIHVVGDTLSYEFVLTELKLLLGRGTVAKLSGGNLSPAVQWALLITELSEIEAGLVSLKRVLRQYLSNKGDWPILSDAIEGYCLCIDKTRSSDGRLSSSIQYERSIQHRQAIEKLSSLSVGQSVYISYAWGDPTPEGQRRGQLVDDLCQSLSASGISVLIDREQVKPGERISAFMDTISKGDVIIVVLSNRYLESEACMYELNGIWTRACHDEHLFLARVIPLTLPDAKLKTTQDFLARGEFWLTQQRDLESRMDESRDSVGPTLFQRYWSIKQFAQHAPDMLVLLLDKQEPRDFERQAQEGFREVVAQILAARSA